MLIRHALPLAVGVALLLCSTGLHAQTRGGAELDVKEGTIVEVGMKGRLPLLKYTIDGGEEQELLLTPKLQAVVEAPGDTDFLRAGQFIAAVATESNDKLFTGDVQVLLFGKQRPPAGQLQKAPAQAGQSVNSWQVSGVISAIGQDQDYPEYQLAQIAAGRRPVPLMLEKDVKVTVKSMDMSLAPAGTSITLEGQELKNGRFNVVRLTAKLADPLKAADVLGAADEGKPAASGEGQPSKEG